MKLFQHRVSLSRSGRLIFCSHPSRAVDQTIPNPKPRIDSIQKISGRKNTQQMSRFDNPPSVLPESFQPKEHKFKQKSKSSPPGLHPETLGLKNSAQLSKSVISTPPQRNTLQNHVASESWRESPHCRPGRWQLGGHCSCSRFPAAPDV